MAEQIERNGAQLYKDAALFVRESSHKDFLLELSAMEVEHEKTFSDMKKKLSKEETTSTVFDPEGETSLYLNVEKFILNLKTLYSNIASEIFIKENEYYYHTVIYLILKLLKADIIEVEKQTNQGRIDAVLFTKKYIFVMEFKMSSVNIALKQIKNKKYYEPYLSDERKIFCVGVAFDKEKRNIKEYKIKTVKELCCT